MPTLKLSATDHRNLSRWYSGMGPAYAVLSRTTGGRETEASPEELAALVSLCNQAEAHEEEAETPSYWRQLRDFLTGAYSDNGAP